jgi:recombination protein RecT
MNDNKKEKAVDIRSLLTSEKVKKELALVLPKYLTPSRFIRIALTTINKTPALAKCTITSLLSCLMDCAQLKIEPDGRKAYLIPFEDKRRGITVCTLIIGYQGLADIARRGENGIASIHADVIYETDKFTCSYGTNGKLEHIPSFGKKGKVIGAYSFVTFKNGMTDWDSMSLNEIEAIRERSKAKENGPWKTDWAEMAKKTAFRRHCKKLPSSYEYQEVFDKDYDLPADILPSITTKPDVDMPQSITDGESEQVVETKNGEPEIKMCDESLAHAIRQLGAKLPEEQYSKLLIEYKVTSDKELQQELTYEEATVLLKTISDKLDAGKKSKK